MENSLLNSNNLYQELLALEERIGDVNTGLSDEVILQSLKERKFSAFMRGLPSLEPCCICQVSISFQTCLIFVYFKLLMAKFSYKITCILASLH